MAKSHKILTTQGSKFILEMFIDDNSKPFDPEWRIKVDGEPPDPQSLYSAECCIQSIETGKYFVFFISVSTVPRSNSFEHALFGEMVYRSTNQKRFTDAFCDQLWEKLKDTKHFPIPRLGKQDLDLERLEREGIPVATKAA